MTFDQRRASRQVVRVPRAALRQSSRMGADELAEKEEPPGQSFLSPPATQRTQRSAPASIPAPQDAAMQIDNPEWQQRAAAPQRGISRRVRLKDGRIYCADFPVPPAIVNSVEERWRVPVNAQGMSEQTHMRYTAATCDPADFIPSQGWTLRTTASPYRSTELLICLTGYNEDRILCARTLYGVMINIRDICKHADSRFWRNGSETGRGPAWQRIVVACVYDGLDNMDKGTLDLFALLGVYQDGIMRKEVDGTGTVMHIFEYTTQLTVDPEGSRPRLIVPASSNDKSSDNLVPVQMILCIKQKNQKKINSHRWLLDGLGRQIEPTVVIFIDMGTKPLDWSLYHLWSAFHRNKKVAGCCGEIKVQASIWKTLSNPLVAAQNFEYKVSNLLDKPMEAAIGFISVLPGAFSAYRYNSLQGRPLQQYFLGDHSLADRLGKRGIAGMRRKNMFLAEDRLLCFELVFHRGKSYKLTFERSAKGETDVPESAIELISQRRRWLNGSLAATLYSIYKFYPRVFMTRHNPLRMLALHVLLVYQVTVLLFTWFNLAIWWLTFTILINLLPDKNQIYLFGSHEVTAWVNTGAEWLFALTLGTQFLLALGAKPKTERFIYSLCLWIFGVLGFYLLTCALVLTINAIKGTHFGTAGDALFDRIRDTITSTAGVLFAALLSTAGGYIIVSVLYLDIAHLITSFIQYLGLSISFVLVLQVFAFCNVSDVSWGTKGSTDAAALPTVKSKEAGGAVVVDEYEKTPEMLDESFRRAAIRAVARPKTKTDKAVHSEDESNYHFRTTLLLLWLLTNLAVVAAVTYINGLPPQASDIRSETDVKNLQSWNDEFRRRQSIFFSIILWTTFFVTLFKLIGSIWFWLFKVLLKSLFGCCSRT